VHDPLWGPQLDKRKLLYSHSCRLGAVWALDCFLLDGLTCLLSASNGSVGHPLLYLLLHC
jgi:hypothetical protein